MKSLLLFFIGTTLFLNTIAQATPGQSQYEMAVDLFNSEEYADGLMILDIAIAKENSDAMILKGDLHYKGKGVEQSFDEAFNWYKKGAVSGNYDAMIKIGSMYADSLVANADYSDAVDFFAHLYDQGNNNASSLVGLAFLEGQGRDQNYDSAMVWFNKGALKNDLNSKYYLSKLKLNDDSEIAMTELEELCNQNYAEACALLGEIYYKGEFLTKNVDQAITYADKGIELNNAKSHYLKSQMILEYAIEGTKKEAVQLVEKAKKLGYPAKDCDFLKLKIYGEMH